MGNDLFDKKPSRTHLALRNSLFGVLGKVAVLLVSFASRTVFIYILGKYYLGVNGLYVDILSVLSLTELGFGSAMTFLLYEPVAKADEEKVRQLLSFYKWVYRGVALAVAILGITILPFIQYLVRGAGELSLFDLRLFFSIYLVNTVTSYFVTYKYALVNALQRTYIITNVETVTSLVCSIVQILSLVFTGSFLIYLLSNTATLIISRIAIALYLNAKYPLVAQEPESPLPDPQKRQVFHEVKGLFVHQFSSVAVHSTDSIIISVVPSMGVAVVGVLSNYSMILQGVSALTIVLINGVAAGFGNIVAVESKEHFRKVFYEANFVDFWIYGLCTCCLFILLPPFIQLWVGDEYLIDNVSLALLLANFYMQGQTLIYHNARIAKGNFNKDKWWSLAQAILNLVISIVGAVYLGLVGVLIGTVVSRLFFVVFRPLSTYRFLFGTSPKEYFICFLKYFAVIVLSIALCHVVCRPLLANPTVPALLVSLLICFALPNAIIIALFRNREELAAIKKRALRLVRKG